MPIPAEGDKFCGARINYRTKEPATCCEGRSDDCTFMMPDGVSYIFDILVFYLFIQRPCFCDSHCTRDGGDCCPDYANECLSIPPTLLPPQSFEPRSEMSGRTDTDEGTDGVAVPFLFRN